MKYAMIDAEKASYPVLALCSALDVSPSGYYAWRSRPVSARQRSDEALSSRIVEIHSKSRGTYGGPRIHAELQSQGETVSRHRVARLMRAEGLVVRRKRRFVPKTTDSNHALPVAPNLLDRNFHQAAPDQAWVGDITYVRTGEGWLYLATLLDLHSRRVVGWAMSETIDRHLVLDALKMAVVNRRPSSGLIHHTDRGSQYASGDYRKALKKLGMKASMSRKGNCWDNAVAESFFSTLKTELSGSFETRADARTGIFEYVEVFYNRQRRHSSIGYLSPAEFEERATSGSSECA